MVRIIKEKVLKEFFFEPKRKDVLTKFATEIIDLTLEEVRKEYKKLGDKATYNKTKDIFEIKVKDLTKFKKMIEK